MIRTVSGGLFFLFRVRLTGKGAGWRKEMGDLFRKVLKNPDG